MVIAPSYLAVAASGYAAFGSNTQPYLVDNFADHISNSFFIVINVFILINMFFVSCIYVQAAFTLIEEAFPYFGNHHDGRYTYAQLAERFAVVAACTLVAVVLPFFGDIAALAGAIGFVPMNFILPFLLWARSKQGAFAPLWKVWMNRIDLAVIVLLGLGAAVGASYFIAVDASSWKFVG